MSKKAFTLIELLAVIIIIGILMVIAVPSVSNYISGSKKSAYVDTAKDLIAGARNKVNEGKLALYNTDVTYYMDTRCIKTENASRSPYGEFLKSYVVINYDGKKYDYYWTSIDDTNQGIMRILRFNWIKEDEIKTDLKETDIILDGGLDRRNYYAIIDENCNMGPVTLAPRSVSSVTGREAVLDFDFIWDEPGDVHYIGETVNLVATIDGYEDWTYKMGWEWSTDDEHYTFITGDESWFVSGDVASGNIKIRVTSENYLYWFRFKLYNMKPNYH